MGDQSSGLLGSCEPSSLSWSFPTEAIHAASARRWFSASVTAAWGPGDATWRAVQVFSEICGNAVTHGTGPVNVSFVIADGHLECDVADTSHALPNVYEADVSDECHRGLALARACADAWDVRCTNNGKVVSFAILSKDDDHSLEDVDKADAPVASTPNHATEHR